MNKDARYNRTVIAAAIFVARAFIGDNSKRELLSSATPPNPSHAGRAYIAYTLLREGQRNHNEECAAHLRCHEDAERLRCRRSEEAASAGRERAHKAASAGCTGGFHIGLAPAAG